MRIMIAQSIAFAGELLQLFSDRVFAEMMSVTLNREKIDSATDIVPDYMRIDHVARYRHRADGNTPPGVKIGHRDNLNCSGERCHGFELNDRLTFNPRISGCE